MRRFMILLAAAAMMVWLGGDLLARGGGGGRGGFGGGGSSRGGGFEGGGNRGSYGGGYHESSYRGGEYGGSRNEGGEFRGGDYNRPTSSQLDNFLRMPSDPVGASAASKSWAGTKEGPGGNVTVSGAGRAAGVEGPGGGEAGRAEGAVRVTGPEGNSVVRAGEAGGARGPEGGKAVAGRGFTAANGHVVNADHVAAVRRGCGDWHGFNNQWFANHPGWRPPHVPPNWGWGWAAWPALGAWCGLAAADAIPYDYGTNVVYDNDMVYMNGNPVATPDQYYSQAQDIADAGQDQPANGDWLPLGVFAIVSPGQTNADKMLQLAVNKDGILRGNYYDKTTDENDPVQGSVDKKSQRAAWTVGNQNSVVYEAGISDLTKDEVPVLMHYGNTATSNLTMVRMQEPQSQGDGNP